ncbi:MAG: hypothetical protein R3348_05200 [Xanthomonadales bacterium]|nr:hypothetical protein [Xanthomonadales bacterium]
MSAAAVAVLGLLAGSAGASGDAADWLRRDFDFIPCSDKSFVYGVAYIDGSYVERIFLAEGTYPGGPELQFRLRGPVWEAVDPGSDLPPAPFVLELRVEKAIHAIPSGDGWQREGGWESALRFKYTTWYGQISRQSGQWQVRWSDYRRPMLPASLHEDPDRTCALFGAAP